MLISDFKDKVLIAQIQISSNVSQNELSLDKSQYLYEYKCHDINLWEIFVEFSKQLLK